VSNTQSSSSSPDAPRPAARPKLRGQRKKRVEFMVLGIATALVIVAVAMPGRPPAPIEQNAPRQLLSQPPSDVEVTVRPTPQATSVPAAAASTAAATVSTPVAAPAKKTAAPKPRTVHPAEAPKAARAEAAVAKPATAKPAAAEPARSAAAAPVTQEIAGPAPVTITGCLEMSVDEKEFRLTDTDGASAPKSRSWRSGFLKKGAAPIELIDAADAHTLVGKRVAATGQLTSRTMRVNSLRVVTPSCS
jgi:hypothetical protein